MLFASIIRKLRTYDYELQCYLYFSSLWSIMIIMIYNLQSSALELRISFVVYADCLWPTYKDMYTCKSLGIFVVYLRSLLWSAVICVISIDIVHDLHWLLITYISVKLHRYLYLCLVCRNLETFVHCLLIVFMICTDHSRPKCHYRNHNTIGNSQSRSAVICAISTNMICNLH